jgi:hypothetical protein
MHADQLAINNGNAFPTNAIDLDTGREKPNQASAIHFRRPIIIASLWSQVRNRSQGFITTRYVSLKHVGADQGCPMHQRFSV